MFNVKCTCLSRIKINREICEHIFPDKVCLEHFHKNLFRKNNVYIHTSYIYVVLYTLRRADRNFFIERWSLSAYGGAPEIPRFNTTVMLERAFKGIFNWAPMNECTSDPFLTEMPPGRSACDFETFTNVGRP